MTIDRIEQIRRSVIVLKCQIGDVAAWEELYRLYNPTLGYYLRRLTGRDQVADDLQQETWLSVVRKIGGLKSPEAFTVWFYRIARNKVMTRLPAHHTDVTLVDEPVAATETSDDDTFSASDAALVHAGLAELRPEHREVLLLRFMEELCYEQIAAVVGCDVGTVRSRIHYGKRALRRQLETNHVCNDPENRTVEPRRPTNPRGRSVTTARDPQG